MVLKWMPSSVDPVVTYTSKKKGKRKMMKARHMEISDAEHSEDMSSSRDITPGTVMSVLASFLIVFITH